MPAKKTFKWIVVTSIQSPTEDVKVVYNRDLFRFHTHYWHRILYSSYPFSMFQRLASYPDWTLVVVGDTKTPADWSLSDVHYLSIEFQVCLLAIAITYE